MIEFTKAFKTSDGETHASLEEAQKHELLLIYGTTASDAEAVAREHFANVVMDNSDRIVDILTTTATSKPRARKVNGGSKQRKPKTPAPEAA